jgi:N-methylhydantoinase A/oxoprolinase/acetone carboxylase beta subunit
LAAALAALAARARAAVGGGADGVAAGDVLVETFVDCRYHGQSHELTVPRVADFPAAHRRRNGYVRDDVEVEVVALRARASRPAPLAVTDLPAPPRSTVTGPAVAAEPDCTLWVPDGWVARPVVTGAWAVTRA